MTNGTPIDDEELRLRAGINQVKQIAREVGADIEDLIALAPDNDPFYCGTPRHIAMAKWFFEHWRERGFLGRGGVHIRRMHYQLVDTSERHDGQPYTNTTRNWQYLNAASRYARYLGLVDPEDIIDRRNPKPHIYLFEEEEQEKGFEHEIPSMRLPRPFTELQSRMEEYLAPPTLEPTGYEYDNSIQPYHVEVWVEKSTMNDILVPVCSGLGVNLVTGVGYLSITAIIALLRRIDALGKPARILYVSDFDLAGRSMPIQVARQCEYWRETYAEDSDIRLQPIVLTQEQIDEFELAPFAAPDDDEEGAVVELDALEGRVPGKLEEIVRDDINRFRDEELSEKFAAAKEGATKVLDEAYKEHLSDHVKKIDELKEEARPTLRRYEQLLEKLAARMERELRPTQVKLNETRHAIEDSVTRLEPPLPDPPDAAVTDPGDEDWMFDARREYMTQLRHYKTPKEWREMHAKIRARHRVCQECGTSFVAVHHERRVYCSSNCRVKAHRRQTREYKQRKYWADKAEEGGE